MHVEVLVEEPSAKVALNTLIPRIVGREPTFTIREHRGKEALLRKLKGRLQGYAQWLPNDSYVFVLVDADREDCHELKERLSKAARGAGLIPKDQCSAQGRPFQVVNRVAIEELEAWFFGDLEALRLAYPGIPATLDRRKALRDPDAIRGGTSERLLKILQRAGHYRRQTRLPKMEVAACVSAHMDPWRNASRSFQVFRDALRMIAEGGCR